MKKITEVYQEYKITPNLQLHQFRVAAVAQQICGLVPFPVDTESVVMACLLHDMGNIIKFRIRLFPELLENKDIEYWEDVQKEYIKKYGQDEHHATLFIAKELGVNDAVYQVMDAIGFHNWCHTKQSGDWERKIATYADSRVAPHGVVSLNDRLEDANRRYQNNSQEANRVRDTLYDCGREIEKEIFEHLSIKPEDINDESIKHIVEELKNVSL